MRTRAKVDATQAEIVGALKKAGATVQPLHTVGKGCPDLLVGYRGRNWLIECKPNVGGPKKQSLRDNQREWFDGWKGQAAVVQDGDAALAVIGAIGLHLAGQVE